MVELTEIKLYLRQLPEELEGIVILHVSDLHIRRFGRNEKCLFEVMRQGCDLMVFSGDFCYQMRISNPFYSQDQEPFVSGLSWKGFSSPPKVDRAEEVCRDLLEDFDARLGVYAIQGNHDSYEFMAKLSQLGVTVLDNETRQVEVSGTGKGRFNVCGVRCFGRKSIDIPATVLGINPELFSLAITHYPETAEALAGAGIDLILAGHTHGGQICLPGGLPVVTHSRTKRKYVRGLNRINHSVVYTTRGLGCSQVPIRIFCPPEITRLTLHKGPPEQTTVWARKI